MNKAKVLSIIAITLLILQMFSSNLGLMAATKNTESDNSTKIKVEELDHNEAVINWKVTINAAGDENDGTNTMLTFGTGHSHGKIKDVGNVKITQTSSGYKVETPEGNNTYEFNLQTNITSEEQTIFSLQAESDYGDKTFKAKDQVTIETSPLEEEVVDEEKVETTKESGSEKNESEQEKSKSEQSEVKKENASPEQNEAEAKEPEDEKQKEKQKSIEEIIAQLKSKPLEEFTEDEIKRLIEGLSEEELQKLEEELGQDEEVVIDPNFKPFVKSAQKFNAMSMDPGSVKLNGKDATPTKNYGEWEIELSVEAKDIDTTKSTDIVIVFDRSGSMQGNRLAKAKGAARQFVNELLTDGSQTRIAIVTFSDSYQTLAGGFQGSNQKQRLITAINGIRATGGTNIQGGIRTANNLLAAQSSAQEKIIVLLSDGEPTYSYKANNATAHPWTYGSYNFRLSNFTNSRIGSGSSYNLSAPTCVWPFPCWGGQQYKVNGYDVKTNGSATISEAWQIMNNGINMYSIGLDVGNNSNATNVLRNSQNKGYYQAGQDDLGNIFDEIAGQLKHAATNAIVTDPLGDMFNLVKDKYNGDHFTATHGKVTWDENTETFKWDIGTIKEGEKPTLKYTVSIDWGHPDLKGHVDYPMNKETPLHYKDANGNDQVKHFSIPKGQIDKGKIKQIGYRMNAQGEAIDKQGNVVNSKEEAQIFYDEYYKENNSELFDYGTYSVPSKGVNDYTLRTNSPESVTINNNSPVQTAWFGYVKTTDLPAGKVTVKYWDENDNEIADEEVLTGYIGDSYTSEEKEIQGYEFDRMHSDGAPATGKFTHDEQTVIYVYKQIKGTIKIIKVDADNTSKYLQGAKFDIINSENKNVGTLETDVNGEATSAPLPIGDYTLVEVEAPAGYELIKTDLTITVEARKKVEKVVKNKQLKGSIKVIKKDKDTGETLKNARFKLEDENNNEVATETTNENGEILFEDLSIGTYYLVETKAPEEYRLLLGKTKVEITANNLHREETIENTKQGWGIPKTGGIGTLGFYGLGIILMVTAVWLVLRRRQV